MVPTKKKPWQIPLDYVIHPTKFIKAAQTQYDIPANISELKLQLQQ